MLLRHRRRPHGALLPITRSALLLMLMPKLQMLRLAVLLRILAILGTTRSNNSHRIPSVRRLRHEEENRQHQHPKEHRTHPKRPLISLPLNNIPRHEGPPADTGQQKQIPHRNPRRPLMHKVHIPNRALHQHLIRRHANARHNPAPEERVILVHRRAPHARNEHDDDGGEVDRAAADDFRERVADEEAQADGQDQPGGGLGQSVDRDVEIGGDLDEAGGEHGPVGADYCGGEAHDEEDELFAPLGPLRVCQSSWCLVMGRMGDKR